MNRRQALAAALAALVGGISLEGVATAGGLDAKSVDEGSFPAFLHELDRLIERHRAAETHPLLTELLQRWGLAADHMQAAASSTIFLSAFRDLAPELQARPEMQDRARVFVPRYGALVLSTTQALRRLPTEELRRYGGLLRSNPDFGPALRRQALRGMEERGVPAERRAQFDALASRLHFRLGRQDPELLVSELVDRVRRAAEAAGLDERDWDAAAAAGTQSGSGASHDDDQRQPLAKSIFRFGLITAGVGTAMFLVGLLGFDALTILGGVVVLLGLLLLVIALVVLIASFIEWEVGEAEPHVPDDLQGMIEAAAPLRSASVPA